ncbi:MAG: DMT family protein [Bacteroidales bacterium]|nr:DMT family protein [Bacteroidales bacterium]MDD6141821.1 DMT family protein [Bacteroidales bacterium]MDD6621969.1 DMT family protein [Bacteroidales bacterium]MDD6669482.1 DMT family protein [Bacteroidales bacterium]
MSAAIWTVVLLIISNVFMTLAWYGHLRLGELGISRNWPLYVVILFSWLIALAEYSFQVPANRLGYVGNGGPFTLVQLKVLQEAITLVVFTIVATVLFQGQSIRWNHIVSFVLLIAAVYFAFLNTEK